MSSYEVVWTVLPNGVASGTEVRLSVLVTPRLDAPQGRLDDVGEFVDWPQTLRRTVLPSLRITWDGQDQPVVPRIDPQAPAADSELWRRLFPPDTPVTPRSADKAAATAELLLRSFPAQLVHDRVNALYRDVGVAVVDDRLSEPQVGEDTPPDGPVLIPARPWNLPHSSTVGEIPVVKNTSEFTENRGAAYDALNGMFHRGEQQANGDAPAHLRPSSPLAEQHQPQTVNRNHRDYKPNETKFALAEAFRFYDRPTPPAGDGLTAPRPVAPDLEFHGVCGFLADYRELSRRLGLVLDLVVTVPAGVPGAGKVRVEFAGTPPPFGQQRLRPWTLFRYVAGQRFVAAAPDTHPVRDGWLSLSGEQWTVTDLDVDSSALKAVNFVDLIERIESSSLPAAEHLGTGSAALQSAGITVFAKERDAWLAAQIGDDSARTVHPDDAVPELNAGHLVRGYRVDVGILGDGDATVTWHSLCRRKGSYTIRRKDQPPYPIGISDDEGCVKSSAVTRDETQSNELYVHQALFGWDGWSLVAPLPGKTINRNDEPEAANPEVSEDFPLDTKFVPVPGSLPALRYGRSYRLRARVVDLAANSLAPDTDGPPDALSEPISYSRWEPVPQPAVVERRPFNEGESSQCLVIRSTVDMSTDIWALRRADTADHNDDPPAVDELSRRYPSDDERHIAPPKSSLQMAERHGKYDDVIGGTQPEHVRQGFFAAAAREAGTFLDTVVSYAYDPTFERDLLFFGEITVAKHDAFNPEPSLTQLPIERGAGLKAGEFIVHTAEELLLPYLPDVLARGATFYNLPGAPPSYSVSFYDDDFRRDTWPKAAPFRLRIEEGSGEPRWRPFPRQLTVFLPKAETATVRVSCHLEAADLGLFRVWHLLTASDYWRRLSVERRKVLTEETVAGLNWMLTPYVELRLVHAVEKPLERPELAELRFERKPEQTFTTLDGGLLRAHAKSSGQVDIDATWRQWVDDVTEPAPHQVQGHAHIAKVDLYPWDEAEVVLPHAQGPIRHQFGDTLHRNVCYRPTATTRFREYFHRSITAQPELITRTGEPSTGPSGQGWPIPSSRRPEPPAPAYLLPTFRWSRAADREAGWVSSLRDGVGIRIYLNRPWFSSGDDELLAVVLDPTPANPLLEALTTQWGTDPVWSDTTALPAPTTDHFPHPAAAPTGLRLVESPTGVGLTVSAAAYQPIYDAAKRLWFCDVDVDLGTAARDAAYFPYLRLALARYQPHSVTGLELSKIVQAEFTQPVPRRTLVVQQTSGHGLLVTTSGPTAANDLGALAGAGLPAVAASHYVLATVQQRDLNGDPELDWQPTGIQQELTCQTAGSGLRWTGEIPPSEVEIIPEYRLLVEEYERYTADPGTADLTVTIAGRQIPVGHRLTYADTVPLTTRLSHLAIDFFNWPNSRNS